ncbi:MAG: hypothetical protein K6C99_01575 [Lachnospiraceae bacterium]|nr:hypothetical protein [Lachnospiraceae bacterium]
MSNNNSEKNENKSSVFTVLFFIALVLFIVAAAGCTLLYTGRKRADKAYAQQLEQLQASVDRTTSENVVLTQINSDLKEQIGTLSGNAQAASDPADIQDPVDAGEGDVVTEVSEREPGEYEIDFESLVFRPFEDGKYKDFCRAEDEYDKMVYQFGSMYSYPTDVVFAGDSLIARCAWNEIYPGMDVKNRGIGGDTVNGFIARLGQIENTEPSKLFILIGVNDILAGANPDVMRGRYSDLMNALDDEFEDSDTEIYFLSLLPVGAGVIDHYGLSVDWFTESNASLKELCEENGYTFINVFDTLGNGSGTLTDDQSIDGIHLKGEQYEKIKEILDPYVLDDDADSEDSSSDDDSDDDSEDDSEDDSDDESEDDSEDDE